jgi:hypothetical protein
MRSNSLHYSLKIWGTALLIAPALNLVVADFIRPPYNGGVGEYILDQLSAYFFTAFFAGIFSVITWFLLFVVIQITIRTFPLKVPVKYITMVTGVLLTIGTFYAVFGWLFNTRDEYFPFMIFTYLCIAAGAYFYKLKIENESENIEI